MADPFDPCATCRAPLAADQRYCLHCGHRRGEPRVDFLALLRRRHQPPVTAPTPPKPVARSLPSPRALALGAMGFILAGVLVGTAVGPSTTDTLAAAARQVVVVNGGVAGTGTSPEDATSDGDGTLEEDSAGVGDEPAEPEAAVDEAATAAAVGEDEVPLDEEAPPAPETDTEEPEPAASEAKPSVGHAFVVVLGGGRGFEETFGASAPAGWLRDELPKRGRLLTGYRAVARSGLANRIAMVSGQGPNPQTEAGCPAYSDFVTTGTGPNGQFRGEGCVYGAEVKTVADQLSSFGLPWRAYVDGLDAPCRRPDGQNPFVYFHSVVDTPDCARSVVSLERLEVDLRKASTTPTLSWIAPDPCHAGDAGPCDGASTPAAATDAFLRRWIPAILRSPAFRKDGLLVVAFDRPPQAAAAGTDAPVGAVVASPFVTAGRRDPRQYDHYGLLRTLEDRLGLEPLGLAGARGVRALRPDVFNRDLAPLAPPEALAATAGRSQP